MNCYISRNYKGISSAGNKAKTDIEKIMQEMKFKNIGLRQTTYSNNILSFLLTIISVIKAVMSISKDDNIVIQYPFKKYFSFICNMTHLNKANVIVVIHDLGSFRRKQLTSKKEIKRLNRADYIICHNENMETWLINHGCAAKIETLKIFDYLSESKARDDKELQDKYSILYAGGLRERKNKFLYDIGKYTKSCSLNLYGNDFEIEKTAGKENINYMGFVNSDELIATAKGDFGLVWDGNSLDECSGNFGEYLKINNPHKVSLYIRCCIPIIIWEKAALANFINENKIGICVDSLKDIDRILNGISKEEYYVMRENVMRINLKISNGKFFKEAIINVTKMNNKKTTH